jgi:beta-lactamase regulating signal transducer with metallopeptidase domain
MVVPTWGTLRLIVPRELVGRLGESQRSVLLLHELTHIHRRDHWVRLLELFVRVAFWWLPVVGFISRQIRVCEEICCDAAVVSRRPESRRDYASLLLDVIDFVTPLSCSAQHATGMNPVDDFERRIRTILHGTSEHRRSWPIGWIAALLALGVVPWGVDYDWRMRSSAGATVRDVDAGLLELNGSESCTPAERPEAIRDVSSLCCPS